MPPDVATLSTEIADRLRQRNAVSKTFFPEEAPRLAIACREMADRFLEGGRLLAFGRGPYATDAQHVSVEFVHPVIVGKRALPALDLSMAYPDWLQAVLQPADIVIGFGPPEGDPEVEEALARAGEHGALTFALPGRTGNYAAPPASDDPFIHQEMIEILYHTLWETVHVFFEHREMGHDVGASGFLYPYLGQEKQDTSGIVDEVASSVETKADEVVRLREELASSSAGRIAEATLAISDRLARGGSLILFGNGGSATDANDWAIDCVAPPGPCKPIPALSLSMEPANLSAVANDVGVELIFLRQFVAQARPEDVAVGFSTSGSSKNVLATLKEARKRGLATLAFVGYDGGEIVRQDLVDFPIVVRSDYVPRIQEAHASVYHVVRNMLERLD